VEAVILFSFEISRSLLTKIENTPINKNRIYIEKVFPIHANYQYDKRTGCSPL
jgi:hypothetical protein